MIRKAEGAILNRTSRLIVVVERCTNDHNYSAILRTVEALGVQNVYIISPQCINQTLTTSIDDEDESDDGIKQAELRSSSGPVIKKATESEKKDRAMHHLYARKATEWVSIPHTVSPYPMYRSLTILFYLFSLAVCNRL